MKQIKICCVVLVLILTASNLHAETKRYEVKSGIIEYVISGGGNIMGIQTKTEGKSKVFFKDWGNVELHDETIKSVIMGGEDQTHQTTKIDNGKVYTVDYQKKIIIQLDPEMVLQSEYKDLGKSAKETMLAMGGKKTGEATLLGYECEIWEMTPLKMWMHKGIMLKSEANIMGMTHTTVATDIKLDASVSDEDLTLPDFPVKTIQEMKNNDSDDIPQQMPKMTPEQMQQMREMMKNFSQNNK